MQLFFDKCDFERKGSISSAEILTRFEHWSELDKVQKLFSSMDANKNNSTVSKDEYMAFWKHRVQTKKSTLPGLKGILIKIVGELNDRDDISFDLTTIDEAIKEHPTVFMHVKEKLFSGQYPKDVSGELKAVL